MPRLAALSALLVLAACAESEPPDVSPAEDDGAYNMIDPVTAEVAQDAGPAIGDWTRTMQEEQPALAFGPAGAEPLFSLRCDDREGLLLQRHGVVLAGEAEMMIVTLGDSSHRLAVNPVAGAVPLLRAAVPANGDLIVELGGATAPIVVAVSDDPVLNLPPSPMIADYIRSCSQEAAPATAEADTGNATEPQQ